MEIEKEKVILYFLAISAILFVYVHRVSSSQEFNGFEALWGWSTWLFSIHSMIILLNKFSQYYYKGKKNM